MWRLWHWTCDCALVPRDPTVTIADTAPPSRVFPPQAEAAAGGKL